ncbi:MAG: hypothetical protein H6673_08235 [Anaerolineales bacterium]|nr:hypothetical protein [Anaerolineales bacterium]
MPLKSSASFETINADLALSLMRLQQSVEEIEAKGRAFLDAIGVLLAIDNPAQGGPNQQDEELPPVIITASASFNLRREATTLAPTAAENVSTEANLVFVPDANGVWYKVGDDGFMWYHVRLVANDVEDAIDGWVRGDYVRPVATWHPDIVTFNSSELENILDAIESLSFRQGFPGAQYEIMEHGTDANGNPISSTVACGPIALAMGLNIEFGLQLTAQDVFSAAERILGHFPSSGLSTQDFHRLVAELLGPKYAPDQSLTVYSYDIDNPEVYQEQGFEIPENLRPQSKEASESLARWAIEENINTGNTVFMLVNISNSGVEEDSGVIVPRGVISHWVVVLDIAHISSEQETEVLWLKVYNPYSNRVEYYPWSEVWGQQYGYATGEEEDLQDLAIIAIGP